MPNSLRGLLGYIGSEVDYLNRIYITLGPAYSIDQKTAVIGQAIKGYDLLIVINDVASTGSVDKPIRNINILDAGCVDFDWEPVTEAAAEKTEKSKPTSQTDSL